MLSFMLFSFTVCERVSCPIADCCCHVCFCACASVRLCACVVRLSEMEGSTGAPVPAEGWSGQLKIRRLCLCVCPRLGSPSVLSHPPLQNRSTEMVPLVQIEAAKLSTLYGSGTRPRCLLVFFLSTCRHVACGMCYLPSYASWMLLYMAKTKMEWVRGGPARAMHPEVKG